ncbi:hypothetical protein [Phytohalomonas tamaricis]|uniref:hypothetical protein n=1 Tax=Phytohalomonas tamaricis TaxID=2081032 RepID=UPI000D0B65A6|nr:hypothetical protein [Phytohalomonas tamaricis]
MQIDPVQFREVNGGHEMYCPKCKTRELRPDDSKKWENFDVWMEYKGCNEIHTLCKMCGNTYVVRTVSTGW